MGWNSVSGRMCLRAPIVRMRGFRAIAIVMPIG